MLDPDMMLGTFASAAAFASIRSAPRRNSSAIPVGAMPKGLAYLRPKITVDCSRLLTSTR